jgi:hypothetical protein
MLLAGWESVSAVRWDGETLLIDLADVQGKAAEVLSNLVTEGIGVEGFAEIPLSLEEAYLSCTGGKTP